MIRLSSISKTYRTGKVPVRALVDINLEIDAGEFIAIMGPSGSGKSTLMHILGFLGRPDSGSYSLFGTEVSDLSDEELAALRNALAGFVFQQFHLLGRVSAAENTELPLIYAGKKDIREKACSKLEKVGLANRKKHRPNELSGGEQQRVAIARALVNEPMIIYADEPTGNLDTKSEEEIMNIIKELNRHGKTIVMVTHEEEIAKYAKRKIVMRDGRIVSDERNPENTSAAAVNSEALSVLNIVRQKHSSIGQVEFAEHVRQSIRAILSNKIRAFLSMLGILFGVAAVIAMLALGEGAKASIEENLKTLGSNMLSVRAGSARVHGVSREAGSVTRFTFDDVAAISRFTDLVDSVSGYMRGSGQVVYKNENWNTSIEGVGFDYGKMRATIPQIGRWFTREEIARREKVAILGGTVVEKLFGDKNPVGRTIKINRIYFKIIGVAPEKGFGGHRDFDDTVYIPVTTAMYRVLGRDYLDSIFVEAKSPQTIDEAQTKIKDMIIKRHRLRADDEDAFYIRNMSEIQEMLTSTTKTMSLLLGCIAAISLLVGGIGIMNIMLVSVTERTREIGLRKAIGARKTDIMSQFLIESVVMTFSGGLMGVMLGVGAAFMLSAFVGWTTKVSFFSIILSTTFSIAVGIGFGLWPARKASMLDPIEALRYE
ncbi:MAG: ABC transporter permease [Candidatus Omnitrophica bacterium]|nr:ABC transporter permease [Candidatus Omnitrophota bacterium]